LAELTPPISIKGVLFEDGRVWLRQNEFGKWELPGGRMEIGEQPEETVIRELREELGVEVSIDRLLDSRMLYEDWGKSPAVFITSYLCKLVRRVGDVEHVGEGGPAQFRAFPAGELPELDLPDVYRIAIQKAGR
jgi:8-oxo-dGTP pyrophosphatase MutT (NUDIX family)